MYYALKVNMSAEHSYDHNNYVLISLDKSFLNEIGTDIVSLDPESSYSIEDIDSEHCSMVSSSYSDYDYAFSLDEGLGKSLKELERIKNKLIKEDPTQTVSIEMLELKSNLTDEEKRVIFSNYTFEEDSLLFLEGYKRKKLAKETGEYYQNPANYDEYKGVSIPMSDDIPMHYS